MTTRRTSKRKEPSDAPAETATKAKQRRRSTDTLAAAGKRAAGDAKQPAWVHSLFSLEQRTQWDAFLRTTCLAHVGADFYDLFELAHSLDSTRPLGAFAELAGVQLCGFFELLERSVRGDKHLTLDKPLFVHGRFFFDPPEVTTLLCDARRLSSSAHWSYFRDAPEQTPEWVVQTDDNAACAFRVVGSSLFHVLGTKLTERNSEDDSDIDSSSSTRKVLAAQVAQYLRFRGLASVTPASASRQRANQATAASLHGLGIVVPYNAKKETGYRELPVVGAQLAELLTRVAGGNDASARKTLSGLLTRATIANDECDFGTSLLLGLDVFTAGAALEKEMLQLLRVAYMLLRRTNFSKILSAHVAHRRAGGVGALSSIAASTSSPSTEASLSHVAETGSRPKLTTVDLP